MGNNSSNTRHVSLLVKHRHIVLHDGLKMSLQIDQMDQFPHGLDGLKLWQAGIVLARYCILENCLFTNKDVLQLGSGVGIGGMACFHWTQCKSITLSDYHPKVIETIKKNIIKNHCKQAKCQLIDWRQYQKLQPQQYDIIMGSDIVYFGCPVKQLYQLFKRLLRFQGLAIIVIPNRKNYSQLFLKQVQNQYFQVTKTLLDQKQYKIPPLQNEQEARKQYPLLYQIEFYVYQLKKINKKV